MNNSQREHFLPILEEHRPRFADRVDTPWDQHPDLPEYNQKAFRRVQVALQELRRECTPETRPASRGLLVLGEAGTGKTHLLMRVRQQLGSINHILFVRKPNNEGSVALHVWQNMIESLTRQVEVGGRKSSQLDHLLANVFAATVIKWMTDKANRGEEVKNQSAWIERLRKDPYQVFEMARTPGSKSLDVYRKRTLQYLQEHESQVDQRIAFALLTYCFTVQDDRKRLLLRWLKGDDLDHELTQNLGLQPSWAPLDESSTEASRTQQREEQALRAIQTIAVLSTYYQPLILAFDQLEGLRDQVTLSRRWGDVVREIFTMSPNVLVVTCIFPSLWETWFTEVLDQSSRDRISQQEVLLEKFAAVHARRMLQIQLADTYHKYGLPTEIYPYDDTDVASLSAKTSSPRVFLKSARDLFQLWIDGDAPGDNTVAGPPVVTKEMIHKGIQCALDGAVRAASEITAQDVQSEEDLFGRVKCILTALARVSKAELVETRATVKRGRVMPPNMVLHESNSGYAVCLGLMNAEGNSFTARLKNLAEARAADPRLKSSILVRDSRARHPGPRGLEILKEFEDSGGRYHLLDSRQLELLNGIYDTLVAVEEQDITAGSHTVTKSDYIWFLASSGTWGSFDVAQNIAECLPGLASTLGIVREPSSAGSPRSPPKDATPTSAIQEPARPVTTPPPGEVDEAQPQGVGPGTRTNSVPVAPRSNPDSHWVHVLLSSDTYKKRSARVLNRQPVSTERIAAFISVLEEQGGKVLGGVLERRLELPPDRLRGLLSVLGRLFNIDGETVLKLDEPTASVELNIPLLKSQFGMEA